MRSIWNLNKEFWWETVKSCPEATFFHTPLWHQLATKTFRDHSDVSVGFELSGGRQVVVPLLAVEKNLFSSFAGCYGGMIATDVLAESEKQQMWKMLLEQLRPRCLMVVENPLANSSLPTTKFSTKRMCTHLLHLGKVEDVNIRFSRGNRSNINKGRKRGVRSRLAADFIDYEKYYAVYERSLRRWGNRSTSHYPPVFFEHGFELSKQYPENLRLWLGERDGEVVSGAWVFYWNQHAVYWHGATHEAAFELRPNNVLHADIIKDACERGFGYYDFNPSGGHVGVERFKSTFGAEKLPVSLFTYEMSGSKLSKIYAGFKRRFKGVSRDK